MSNRGMPSILALLGMAAVAGFQHRDKLGQILGQVGDQVGNRTAGSGQGANSSATGQGGLMGGLNDLLDTFRNSGQREQADSWITPGVPTQGLSRDQVEQAIGRDNLMNLSRDTGLDYDELLNRLAQNIPEAVDRATPDGRFPQNEDELRQRFSGL
ncbi:YidB family protein [Devosia sp. WQ 349K1]|uniref:YidB family protein n=1 Tax=Devosia sp. WQ 349K1 TaxID=2800329 RepID=UPI001AEE9DAD|nr:YidB family protein [Devosia sp. WQ 349K1]